MPDERARQSNTAIMDFDDILEELGEFGRYQITNYLLICLPVFFCSANSLSYVFTAGVPDYRCFVPGCDNVTNPDYSADWVSRAVPSMQKPHSEGTFVPAQCTRYKNPSGNSSCPDEFLKEEETCDRWVFKDNEWTIVGEWNITCSENQWMLSLVGTSHFAGVFLGTIVFGFLADKFGRKLVFIFCIVLMSITGIAQAVSPDYITFQVFVFINALGTSGVYPLAFIIGVELVGRRRREMSGIVLNYFYALGEAAVALIAWLTKDWKMIQLLVSAPAGIFVLYYWLIPESVRWLLAKQQNSKATLIIRKAADMNGVQLSERLLTSFSEKEKDPRGLIKAEDKEKGPLSAMKEVCKSRKLVVRALMLFFIWASCAFVYYGLSVNSTSMGGDKYLNFALVCLVEIPGYTMSWITMNKFGRRRSLAASLFLCSITCLGAAFAPQGMVWAEILLFLIGKLGITSSFGIVFVFTAELYPTMIRSAGVGASSTMARIGAMVAPFAPLLAQFYQPLPMIIFCAVSFLACLLCLPLPETLGTKLPDTIEEVENL
ncbi:organic cation transporter protein isoform X2 [Anabrus simplex]|uniref:organic cation transporter protein isoform X2 n=1 Tax=Anabrus simplex TaxID=316456 RepID=UPI0034DD3BDA